jgi:hypothetical protein
MMIDQEQQMQYREDKGHIQSLRGSIGMNQEDMMNRPPYQALKQIVQQDRLSMMQDLVLIRMFRLDNDRMLFVLLIVGMLWVHKPRNVFVLICFGTVRVSMVHMRLGWGQR